MSINGFFSFGFLLFIDDGDDGIIEFERSTEGWMDAFDSSKTSTTIVVVLFIILQSIYKEWNERLNELFRQTSSAIT